MVSWYFLILPEACIVVHTGPPNEFISKLMQTTIQNDAVYEGTSSNQISSNSLIQNRTGISINTNKKNDSLEVE